MRLGGLVLALFDKGVAVSLSYLAGRVSAGLTPVVRQWPIKEAVVLINQPGHEGVCARLTMCQGLVAYQRPGCLIVAITLGVERLDTLVLGCLLLIDRTEGRLIGTFDFLAGRAGSRTDGSGGYLIGLANLGTDSLGVALSGSAGLSDAGAQGAHLLLHGSVNGCHRTIGGGHDLVGDGCAEGSDAEGMAGDLA